MNIAIIITSLEVGGAEKIVVETARYLKEYYKIKIFVIKQNYNSVCDILAKKYNLSIIYLNNKFRFFNLITFFKLRKLLNCFGPDIIHTHLKASDYIFFYLLKRNSKPIWIHTVHTIPKVDCPFPKRLLYRSLFNNRQVNIIAVSKYIQQKFLLLYPKSNVYVINNGVDTKIFKKENNSQKNITLVHVGRFTPVKNHFYLLDEFRKVLGQFPNTKMILIGAGRLRFKVMKRALKDNINQHITFVEHTNKVEKYLKNSDIFVLPSLYEGFPLSLLEAMACGLITISSSRGESIIENGINGFITDIKPGGLSNVLEYVIKNIGSLDHIRSAAIKTAHEYSLIKTVAKYRLLYDRIL